MSTNGVLVKTHSGDLWAGENESSQWWSRIAEDGTIFLTHARQIMAAEVGGGTVGITGIANYGIEHEGSAVTSPVSRVLLAVEAVLECREHAYQSIVKAPTCTVSEYEQAVQA